MRKKKRAILPALLAMVAFATSYYLIDRFSFARELQPYPVGKQADTTLTIGIIGDSWVAGGKLDSLLDRELRKKGKISKIISSGHPGAKSKLIYQNMFKDKTERHSSKPLIESKPDYCIVIAGVNDALGQTGARFYSHHLTMIINTLIEYHIKPIVVELPEFGIIEATNELSLVKKIRNRLFSEFNNNGELDNIETYRTNLDYALNRQKFDDDIIFVDFDKVCSDYEEFKEIYKADGVHLNEKGNELLCQIIANEFVLN